MLASELWFIGDEIERNGASWWISLMSHMNPFIGWFINSDRYAIYKVLSERLEIDCLYQARIITANAACICEVVTTSDARMTRNWLDRGTRAIIESRMFRKSNRKAVHGVISEDILTGAERRAMLTNQTLFNGNPFIQMDGDNIKQVRWFRHDEIYKMITHGVWPAVEQEEETSIRGRFDLLLSVWQSFVILLIYLVKIISNGYLNAVQIMSMMHAIPIVMSMLQFNSKRVYKHRFIVRYPDDIDHDNIANLDIQRELREKRINTHVISSAIIIILLAILAKLTLNDVKWSIWIITVFIQFFLAIWIGVLFMYERNSQKMYGVGFALSFIASIINIALSIWISIISPGEIGPTWTEWIPVLS